MAISDADKILRDIARTNNVLVDDIRGYSKTKKIAYVRNIALYQLRGSTTLSWREIGMVLGGRKSSTVIRNYQHYVKNF